MTDMEVEDFEKGQAKATFPRDAHANHAIPNQPRCGQVTPSSHPPTQQEVTCKCLRWTSTSLRRACDATTMPKTLVHITTSTPHCASCSVNIRCLSWRQKAARHKQRMQLNLPVGCCAPFCMFRGHRASAAHLGGCGRGALAWDSTNSNGLRRMRRGSVPTQWLPQASRQRCKRHPRDERAGRPSGTRWGWAWTSGCYTATPVRPRLDMAQSRPPERSRHHA